MLDPRQSNNNTKTISLSNQSIHQSINVLFPILDSSFFRYVSSRTSIGIVGERVARRGRDTVFFGHGSGVRRILPFGSSRGCQTGHLQTKAQCGKSLHEYFALIGGDGSDIYSPLFEYKSKALVRVGGFTFLSENGRARVHGVLWVG